MTKKTNSSSGRHTLASDDPMSRFPDLPIASPDHRLTRSFKTRPAMVAYVTCGDPDIATTREIVLAACRAGADVIELGVPFSDPVADGPVIQRASERALKQGTSLEDVLRLAAEVRKETDAGLIVFTYLNPILRFGVERFCAQAAKAGVHGALVTDLTVEEAGEYRRMMAAHNLDTVFLAAPTSPDQRLKAITGACQGFVYAVSRTGITGAQKQLAADAQGLVKRIRKFTRLPIAVGFGISNPQQFAEVGLFADAVVVGSAIVQLIEQNPGKEASAVEGFVRSLKAGASRAGASQS